MTLRNQKKEAKLGSSNLIIIIKEALIKMYQSNPKVRDAQNPYRTGVLIGNYVEDKFGLHHAGQPVS